MLGLGKKQTVLNIHEPFLGRAMVLGFAPNRARGAPKSHNKEILNMIQCYSPSSFCMDRFFESPLIVLFKFIWTIVQKH